MGFYDEFDAKPKRKSSGTWVASIIIAALVGSGSTLLMVPTMLKANMIKMPDTNQNVVKTNGSVSNVTVVNSDVVQAVNRVKPAVVTVVNLQKVGGFFSKQAEQEVGKGSGVIIDKAGHIVTNNHVVDGASDVEVAINNKQIKAKVLGTDLYTDLAVLQVPADSIKDIQPAELGSSDALQTGEPAIAIGNPLGEFEQTVTVGVISAKNRKIPMQDQRGNVLFEQTVLQTDAAINPGNSGGALINIKGQLIGINSAKIASSGVEGLGFAIPIDEAKPIIDQLMTKGKVQRPALGVQISNWDVKDVPENYRASLPIDYGVIVSDVTSGGPADKAGIKKGDVIAEIDNNKLKTFVDLRKYLFSKKPGDTVELKVYRDKNEMTVKVTLAPMQ